MSNWQPQGPNLSRPTPSTVRRWRPQGSLGLSGAEAVIPLGLSQDLSATGPHGRTLRPESTGRELLDPSVSTILRDALDSLSVLPERNPNDFARSQTATGTEPRLIIDGTERRRQRPKSPEKQALHYSGKKRRTPIRTSSSWTCKGNASAS